MTSDAGSLTSESQVDPIAVRRKVARRIQPLVFVLYIVAYLDRANVGFAKLRMTDSLGFSESVFGWGFGLFFAGYLLLEIPGALLVERWSARKWFTRILVTWGFCSMGMAFVRTPTQFYVMRFLLGFAESGFFPGVIVYFTHWFPRAERGRALAGMVLAIPVSLALGSRVSGMLMDVGWLRLEGWQWVFLIEGLPAVLLGLALPWLMTDRPAHARWLNPSERAWLDGVLNMERKQVAASGGGSLGPALRSPTVWLLALGILATNTGGYALVFWLPTAIENLLKATRGTAGSSAVLNWTGFVYLWGLAGVWLSGRSSDRFHERKWHCVVGQVLAGVFLAASVRPGQSWESTYAWICAAGFFAYFWPSPFWVLPTLTLSASAAAVSIGVINMCANLAGLLGSPIVGRMKSSGFGDRACLLFLAACYATGGVIVAFLRVPKASTDASRESP
jgi:MFS transporter, ACS family, tartrate transporter